MSANDSAVGSLPMKGALGIVGLEFAFLLTARANGPIYCTFFSQASFHQQVAAPHPTKGIIAGELNQPAFIQYHRYDAQGVTDQLHTAGLY